ncbi:MAG: hypothetical protein PHY99_10475, partial [Bacteroidales bacterium]|nr:hypothetical protein [Bacteroidales bacterium]
MRLFVRKYLVCVMLILSVSGHLFAQEKKIPFFWVDASENRLAGVITAKLVTLPGEGLYQLELNVLWNDSKGNPITENDRRPLLCLTKYDFDLSPAKKVICNSIEREKNFSLMFRSSGKLDLQALNGYEGEMVLTARFQYALTPELYKSGKWELIELMRPADQKMAFQVRSFKPVSEDAIAGGDVAPKADAKKTLAIIQIISDRYQKTLLKVDGFENRKLPDSIHQPKYLADLEELLSTIELEKANLNPDLLPTDTYQLYRERYNHLNDAVLGLKSAYVRSKTSEKVEVDLATTANRLREEDNLRNAITAKISPVIKSQIDSLSRITKRQAVVGEKLNSYLSDPKNWDKNSRLIDSLINCNSSIRKTFLALNQAHENTWRMYRQDLGNMMPVIGIDSLHVYYVENQNTLLSHIEETDRIVLTIKTNQDSLPWYQSNRLVWIGLLAVLLLIISTTIWNALSNRRNNKRNQMAAGNGLLGISPINTIVNGDIPALNPDGYYMVDYQDTIPESMVGMIHYHPASVKTVYHLAHSVLSDRNASDFGGYLFGNQYKLHGKGAFKSELFIEKACESKYLRSTIPNDIAARADLLDELDELVRQNNKYRLIGWFTSCADQSMEIPEGLMKIHRTFFKEKWQIGILLNPDSDVLQSASYLRRKSGYLDPMPDPAAFIKWEDLYSFALNPGSSGAKQPDDQDHVGKNYSTIDLNNTWGDSVVTSVSFDASVMEEIMSAAANQAIPVDTYQPVGFLYGKAILQSSSEGKSNEYKVFVDRFIELRNESTPRELPGYTLIGWWGQAKVDILNYVQSAVDFHEEVFREAYQISCLMNPVTEEL